MLSDVMEELGLDLDGALEAGEELVDFSKGEVSGADRVYLQELNRAADLQNKRRRSLGMKPWKRKEREEKAKNYLRVRRAEHEHVLPWLEMTSAFDGQIVVPGHVGNPDTYKHYVGGGVFLGAADKDGNYTHTPPWIFKSV
jgi:hypothetical protein